MSSPAGPDKRPPTRERFPSNRRSPSILPRGPKPPWLKIRIQTGDAYKAVRRTVETLSLHTVCQEARCPNIFECWGEQTATFMILGDVCTRRCGFCAVMTGTPRPVDPEEPRHLAEAVDRMELAHAVITSVDRDDLPDGGAAHFAAVIRAVKARRPGCAVEVLTPDFRGAPDALAILLEARPDVFAHNIETVPRLYRTVRPGSSYEHSLGLLAAARREGSPLTKSGLMLGLGERRDEVFDVLCDLREAGVGIVTIGQYLQPSAGHLPVFRYVPPDEFDGIRREALPLGFRHVEAGPLVRSSYHASRHLREAGGGNPAE
ncbi:MAG TPA: lipoyl synthase [Candidatus Polarisedimenticolia bacterium]|nr:lipoyl synthase [Candidatus Polarisedimenticolia bacterium]